MERYTQNLRLDGNRVLSYNTHVATITSNGYLIVLGYWSKTTSKHINYVADQYDLKIVDTDEYLRLS